MSLLPRKLIRAAHRACPLGPIADIDTYSITSSHDRPVGDCSHHSLELRLALSFSATEPASLILADLLRTAAGTSHSRWLAFLDPLVGRQDFLCDFYLQQGVTAYTFGVV